MDKEKVAGWRWEEKVAGVRGDKESVVENVVEEVVLEWRRASRL